MAVWEKVGTRDFKSDTSTEGLFNDDRMVAKITICGLKYYPTNDEASSLAHVEVWDPHQKDLGYCKTKESAKKLVNLYFGLVA